MKIQETTINALSELCGLDRRRIKKTLNGLPPLKKQAGANVYDLGAALRLLFAAADAAGSDSPEIQSERLRMLRAQADRQEHALASERGQVIDVDEAYLLFCEVAFRVRAKFLQFSQLAGSLEGKSEAAIRSTLDSEVAKLLTELSQMDAQATLDAIKAAARGETPNNRKAE